MARHPSVEKSFFLKVLLFTAALGNLYLLLEAVFHSFNLHGLDLTLRWYAFKAAPLFNLVIAIGAGFTLFGIIRVRGNGISSYKVYFFGKLITLLGFVLLTVMEYKIAGIPYPILLLPLLLLVESIYPILLYISLRKSKTRRLY